MSQNADESDLKEDYPSQLRDSLRCQILLNLVLQLPRLTVIPRTVFEHMPLLEVLDLSSTSIQSLPSSVSSLSSLKELLLRDCSFLIELPIEIGMLTKLKLLDIEGSEIMYIPKEIVELTDLEVLRLCLSQYAEYYIKAKNVNGGVKVPRMMISELKKLKEFCISVCQEAEWWEKEIKEIQDEICHLENLEFLKWYLPTDTTLKQFLDIQINRKPAYEKLSNFTFTIGQHAQLTSCLPRGLEKKFAEFEKCLKWINAEGNIYDISKIMTRAKALFLSRHWTIVNLSAFDISKLKYFLLAECNEMETLVKIDDLSEIVENNKKSGLESLEYLSIHYMEKLKSIWEGPIGKDSLSRLRILALHTCLELTTIFTPRIAQNLSCLAELTVEECPKVRSLIITPHSQHGPLFPSLERIFLIDLPELDHIFGGLIVLEKLEILMIYNCIKLRRLSEMELPRIQKIKGENKWWNSLNAYEPTWENFFEPLKEKSELIKQLLEATNSLQHFHDVVSHEAKDEKPLDGPGLGAQETKIEPFNFPLRKEEGRFHTLPGTEGEFDVRTSFRIKGTEGELDVIYRRLGLSGAEDFAISTVDWENRRSYSPIVGRVGSLPVSIKDYDGQLSLDFERKADLKDKTEINNGARVLEDGDDVENDKTGKRGIKGAGLQYTISPNGTFKGIVKNWQKGDLLGSGSFGTVYEGFDESGFLFAVKEVSLPDQGSQGKQSIFQLQQEISLLSQFHHENIVRYLGTDTDDGKLYIFLELVTKGSLAKLYQKYHLGDSQVSAYTRQILSGLNYLHERKVVHRDIKCANILVDTSGSVKLADFGLANALNDIKSCKGTPYWVAPEVVDNRAKKGYGLAADIWSLGCTVLEMLTRKIPYYHLEGMQALFRISRGEPPEIPNTLSAAAQDFILKCLQVNPNDRPTAAQLLEHPFLRNQHL
ncbi:cysteine oxygenase/2-aminoethanethiol dioxygenase [Artemisia annua]|uniref:mitogen-activated protein kinase kinase kinase n=1 Tax=Artemisia annua TaxID=35608 RepID=A0A2U1PZQ4_ARTAN|nr:cysteine oxygenase/2-aminoethanethiol dioxygenase [Artemisia annua]